MLNRILCAVFGLALIATPVVALPSMPSLDAKAPAGDLLVKVATKAQKAAGRRACRAKYGARLAYVTFRRNQYICHFRKSNQRLTKDAARQCSKSGLRLARVNSIRIKGNKSITRYTCKR
jgi:hypothetical protein